MYLIIMIVTRSPSQVYCDMSDSGGWMKIVALDSGALWYDHKSPQKKSFQSYKLPVCDLIYIYIYCDTNVHIIRFIFLKPLAK